MTSKRRKGFPSEARVKRGQRIVHGGKELIEKLGRNDPCPCGSGRSFQALLPARRLLLTARAAITTSAERHGHLSVGHEESAAERSAHRPGFNRPTGVPRPASRRREAVATTHAALPEVADATVMTGWLFGAPGSTPGITSTG
ncbi:MAG: SEC-C domain-containing protein [Rubrivivax sp.]|nr:SEC-C domain-containing protein [Rubrivivax sp.]